MSLYMIFPLWTNAYGKIPHRLLKIQELYCHLSFYVYIYIYTFRQCVNSKTVSSYSHITSLSARARLNLHAPCVHWISRDLP